LFQNAAIDYQAFFANARKLCVITIFIKGNTVEMNWRKKDLFDKGLIKPYWPMRG
ncbi:MAG: hypothetical protein HGA85_06935, partial [Nanoarchaeota archaeon]|nr:hypothetical protein [Nanoarchaeota archaeon]